jgi:sortase (surface protein transpeptidase)
MSLIYATSPKIKKTASYINTRGILIGDLDNDELSTKKISPLSRFKKNLLKGFFDLIIILAITSAFAIFIPKIVYSVYTPVTINVEGQFTQSALGGEFANGVNQKQYVPPLNKNLPEGNWLEIPFIDVRSEFQDTQDSADALDTGVWLDPQYGQPGDNSGLPVILAAHRYGWKWWWKDEYWQYHSFYNLPETQPGDIIEITSGQRKYRYEIYEANEGEQLTDVDADLILYTCKYLNSSIRHFRYARLIDPSIDSQS